MAILKDGTIPATRQDIFRSGAEGDDFRPSVFNFNKITITKITIFNKILTMQTIILSVRKKFGEFRKLQRYVLKQNENAEYLEHGEFLPLDVGDVLLAETTTEDAVDFVVYGQLE